MLAATNAGEVRIPSLTSLTGIRIALDATGVMPIAQLTSIVNGFIGVSGGRTATFPSLVTATDTDVDVRGGSAFEAPALTAIDGMGLRAEGASRITIPAATSYAFASTWGNDLHRSWQAFDAGSRIELSGLTSLTGGRYYNNRLFIQAQAGGVLDLSSLREIIDPETEWGYYGSRNIEVSADGAGSLVRLEALASFTDRVAADFGWWLYSRLQATSFGRLQLGSSPLSLLGVSVTTALGGVIDGSLVLRGSSVIAAGAAITGTIMDAFTVSSSGTSVTFSGRPGDDRLTLSVGPDGRLRHDIVIAGNLVSPSDLDAVLPGEQSILARDALTAIYAGDGNDTIDVSTLGRGISAWGGNGNDAITVGIGGSQIYGESGDDTLTIQGTSATNTLVLAAGSFVLDGVSSGFSGIDGVRYVAGGGRDRVTVDPSFALPFRAVGVAPFVSAHREGLMIVGAFIDPGDGQAWTGGIDLGDGAGFRPLTLAADGTFAYQLDAEPTIDMTVRIVDDEGNVGTTIALAGTVNRVVVGSSGLWSDPASWSMGHVPLDWETAYVPLGQTLTIDRDTTVRRLVCEGALNVTSGTVVFTAEATVAGRLQGSAGATIRAEGSEARLSVDGVGFIDGVNLVAAGGARMTLAGLASYDAGGSGWSLRLEATGAGSRLELPALSQVRGMRTWWGGGSVTVAASSGGAVSAPLLTTIPDGVVFVRADGAGSRVDLPALASWTSTQNQSALVTTAGGTVAFAPGGIVLGSVTVTVSEGISLSGGRIELRSGAVLTGAGTVPSILNTAGAVRPGDGVGRLTVAGDFTQAAGGTLALEIAEETPVSQHDLLAVAGTLALGGTVSIARVADYAPPAGARVGLITCATRTADVPAWQGLDFGGSAIAIPELTPIGLDVSFGFSSGPAVVALEPADQTTPGPFLFVTFSEPVDPASFSPDDVRVLSPDGLPVAVMAPEAVAGSGATRYRIRITGDTIAAGAYTVTIGPNVADLVGNPMNQSGDAANGAADDSFSGSATLAAVDLGIRDLRVVEPALESGKRVTIRWTDVNRGAIALPGVWHDRLRVFNTTTGQTLLDTAVAAAGTLAVGGTEEREYAFLLPDGLPGVGTLSVEVTVDGWDSLGEFGPGAGERDNLTTVSRESSLAGYPDLRVQGLSVAEAELRSGGLMTIRWSDTNTGIVGTTASWYDRVVVRNTTTGRTILDVGVWNPTMIGAGAALAREYSFMLPDGSAGAGTMSIEVTADALGSVFEYAADAHAEANNAATVTRESTIAPYADLAVSAITAPATAMPGATVTVSWTVTNVGTATVTGPWSERISLSSDGAVGDDAHLATVTFEGSLAPGATVTPTATVVLPVFVAGTQRIVVETGVGRGFYDPSTDNNMGIATAATNVAAALLMTLSQATFGEGAGASAATVTVTRNGSTAADLVVSLASSAPGVASVPATVTIPAGSSSAPFAIGASDDAVADGSHTATITATASGFAGASATVTSVDDDVARLTVSLAAASIAENAASPATTGTVTRNTSTATALVVALQSDAPSRARVPATVTIPAGATSATFNVTAVDNVITDGSARVTVLATAAGLSSASDSVVVTDDDLVSLALTFTTRTITEGQTSPAAIGTVARSIVTDQPMVVLLSSASPSALAVPIAVTIPANRASVQFGVNAPEDALSLGTRAVVLTARPTTTSGLVLDNGAASATFTVLDNDGPRLTLVASNVAVREGTTVTGTVTRNTDTAADLVVSLASGDTTEATVPATVTIPAGSSSATFAIQGVADARADGTQSSVITASAAGFNPGSFTVLATDADLPDLRVAAVSVPATGIAGMAVTISWTVINSGTVAATGMWNDRLFLSADDQLGDDVLFFTRPFSGTLGVGESYTRTETVSLPVNLGDFKVIAVADGPAAAAAGGASAGFVAEASETNNARVSTPITLSPAYRAEVSAGVEVSPLGAPVPLSGRAFDPATGAAAAGVPVTVRVNIQGTRRVIPATTAADGTFAVTFQPLATEAGQYTVSADHPGVTADTVQDSFRIYGLRADVVGYRLGTVVGSPSSATVSLKNLGDVPLTGLTVEVLGATSNVTVTTSSATTIPAGGSIPFTFTVTALSATPASSTPTLRIATAEGASFDFPLDVPILPMVPRLLATPGFLERGMLCGQTSYVSFEVTNAGGAAAEDVRVLLPDVPWMRVVNPSSAGTIAAGGRMTVTLSLSPAANLPLGSYPGSIAVVANGSGESIGFNFRAVSDAVGDVRIDVQDEFTFYQADKPQVAGATVVLRDPYNSSVVKSAVTGPGGTVSFAGVAQGRYLLEVDAPKHAGSRTTIDVLPGTESTSAVFLQRQTVSYTWTVTPTQIEDKYDIVLDADFETAVPAPVVRLTGPALLPALGIGESTTIEITAENLGLIAAEDFRLSFLPHDNYRVTPLVDLIPVLPAKSQVVIPVSVTRVNDRPVCADLVGIGRFTYGCGVDESGRARILEGSCAVVVKVGDSYAECTIKQVPEAIGWGSGGGPASGSLNVDFSYRSVPAVESVVARVRVRLNQTASMTRSAFNGALDIDNGNVDAALSGVQVTLDFRDAAGNSVNDLFFVQTPRLDGLTAVDGTGVIAAGHRGSAQYTIIPTRRAAPAVPTTYTVGGTLRYIDPDGSREVVIPLLGASITVYPDPNLELDYFWQRDVIGDDPFTDEVEPSEPFAVGLVVTNSGNGDAQNFVVTSAQPRIVENERGLLIDFRIVGTQVDVNAVMPALTVNFGDIGAGQTAVGQWWLESSLQGKFIDFVASFSHSVALGGKATSLIDTVRIHELIRSVRVANPTDDGRPDFLANDVPDADHLPDTLWFGKGGKADVKIATAASASGAVRPGSMSITVTATMTAGWNYVTLPDPGAGYRVATVTRSDGRALPAGSFWQSDRSFPPDRAVAVRENLLHVLDNNGTGSYTVTYLLDDSVAPQVVDVVDVAPDPHVAGLDAIDVVFSEPIDLTTFTATDVTLSRNGGTNLIAGGLSIAHVSGSTYRVSGLAPLTAAAGVDELRVNGAGIADFGGSSALGSVADVFAVGDATPFVDRFATLPAIRTGALDMVEVTFSEPLADGSFAPGDVELTRDGGPNLVDGSVAVSLVTGATWRIRGLSGLTAVDGVYRLTVNATGVTDASTTAGVGSASVTWVKDALAPTVASVETLATNPRNIVVPHLDVTFSEAIDAGTFGRDDISLRRDGVPVTLDDRVTIDRVSTTVYRISGFNWVSGLEGAYALSVSASDIADLAGNVGVGSASTSWVMDTTAPAAAEHFAITPANGLSATDFVTIARTVTVTGTIGELGLAVRFVDLAVDKDLGYATVVGNTFTKTITLTSEGLNRIQIKVIDEAGNVNRESRYCPCGEVYPEGSIDIVVDRIAPLITALGPVTPATRVAPVDSIDVTFSEPIDAATLDWSDVSLTLDGGANLVTSGVTIAPVAGLANTYRIGGLMALTAGDGAYRLTVAGLGISDIAGNAAASSHSTDWLMDGGGTVRLSGLTGRVFHDYDGDGVFGADDEALAGWTVYLDTNANGVYDAGTDVTRTTGADGRYLFAALAAGTYSVGMAPPDGWNRSLPVVSDDLWIASVAAAQTVSDLDFGFFRAGRVEGTLYNDVNANGVRDAGEPGLPGWTVYLDDDGNGILDSGEPSTTTGADGSYVFTGLVPGVYAVAHVAKAGWEQTSPGVGGGTQVAGLSTPNLPFGQSLVIFDQRCPCMTGKPTSFATGLPTSPDGSRFAWADADPSTPSVTDIRYDFRDQAGRTNVITSTQISLVERAFALWEEASGGTVRFVRDVTAPGASIINVGVGDLAVLGGTSGQRGVLGLGGAVYAPLSAGGLRSGVVWLDMAETWDVTFGNGNVAGAFDFFSVAAHEIGHAIGLEHMDGVAGSDLMNGIYGGERTMFSAADSAAIRSLYGAGAVGGAATSGWVIMSVTPPGAHVVEISSGTVIYARDFGNRALDATPPVLTITSEKSALKIGETATLRFTLSEPVTGFDVGDISVTGGTLSGFSGSGTMYSVLFTPAVGFTGDATVAVAARKFTDTAGNLNTAASLSAPISVDTEAPASLAVVLKRDTGSSTVDAITSDGTLLIAATEADALVEYSIDGGSTWTSTFKAIEGKNTVGVRQADRAGNVSETTMVDFTLDATAPAVPLVALVNDTGTSAVDGVTKDGRIAVSAVESGARIEYSLNGGAWWSSFVAAVGVNVVKVRQADAAGNVSAEATRTFTLDTSAATITGIILPVAGNYATGATLSISVTFSEAVLVSPYTGPATLRASMTPFIELTIGGKKVRATYASGSGTSTLVFSYRMLAADKETNAVGVANVISLAAGNWIRDVAGNDASLGFASRLPAVLPRIRVNSP